jgi:hypothetical protein
MKTMMRLGWLGSLGLMASLASGGCYEGVGTASGEVFTVNRLTGEVCAHRFLSARSSDKEGVWHSRVCESDEKKEGLAEY